MPESQLHKHRAMDMSRSLDDQLTLSTQHLDQLLRLIRFREPISVHAFVAPPELETIFDSPITTTKHLVNEALQTRHQLKRMQWVADTRIQELLPSFT
jgi:hypothetical protein